MQAPPPPLPPLMFSHYGDPLAPGYGARLIFSYYRGLLAWDYGALLISPYYGGIMEPY